MVTIVDIVDQKRVVVDGPDSGVHRHMMPVKRLSLTDLTVKIPRGAREKTLKKALKENGTMAKWSASAWGKKTQAKATRATMSDFDRFKLMLAKKRRSQAVKKSLKPKKK